MPRYTVKNAEGREVTFDWHGQGDPTDADMEEVFAAAGSAQPEAKLGPAEQMAVDHARSRGEEASESERQFYRNIGDGSGLIGGGVKVVGEKALGVGEKIARRIYSGLMKPKQGLKDSFGGAQEIAGTLLNERAPITRGGVAKVTGRLADSRSKAMGMVKAAEDQGMQGVVAKDVISEFAPVVTELRKRVDIGQANELGKVGARGKAILATTSRHAGDVPLTRAQALKETAQDAASGAYRAKERGLQKQLGADDMLDESVARGFRKGIERKVPGVGPQNARTQSLIGGRNALEDAVEREGGNNMLGGGRDWAAMMAGGAGMAAGGPAAGAMAGGAMRLMATPSTGSMAAIALNEASKSGAIDAATRAAILGMLRQRSQE
jgi:hypothetical protein